MKTLKIMADFGADAFGWVSEQEGGRGYLNVIDSQGGFPPEWELSSPLQKAFSDWAARFENKMVRDDFDWDDFHEKGLALTRRLKEEVGNRFDVVYRAPPEDPARGRQPEILFP